MRFIFLLIAVLLPCLCHSQAADSTERGVITIRKNEVIVYYPDSSSEPLTQLPEVISNSPDTDSCNLPIMLKVLLKRYYSSGCDGKHHSKREARHLQERCDHITFLIHIDPTGKLYKTSVVFSYNGPKDIDFPRPCVTNWFKDQIRKDMPVWKPAKKDGNTIPCIIHITIQLNNLKVR